MSIAPIHEETNIFDAVDIVNWTEGCHLNKDGSVKPGIYRGMPNHVYHGSAGYSSTIIKGLAKTTPLHVKRTYLSDEARQLSAQQRKVFEVGGLYHEVTLETDEFYKRYVRLPSPDKYDSYTTLDLKELCETHKVKKTGTKRELKARLNAVLPTPIVEYEDTVEDFIKKYCHPDAVSEALKRKATKPLSSLLSIIKEEDIAVKAGILPIEDSVWQEVHEMNEVTLAHPLARATLCEGEAELSVFVYCPKTGLLLKCRYDFLNIYGEAVDLKSARSVDPMFFKSDCKKLRYDLQEQFYLLVGKLANLRVDHFFFVGCEKGEAVICEVFELGKKTQAHAYGEMQIQLETLAKCIETDVWHSYQPHPRLITLELF